MDFPRDELQAALLSVLGARGLATSAQLQKLTGKSQPTVSRALLGLGSELVTLGQGKATRYGLAVSILGLSAQQPLWWTDAAGKPTHWGDLTFLAADRLHVSAPGIDVVTRGQLPWFLTPLRLQGFLGRAWAMRLGQGGNPERWTLAQTLFAALRVGDAPGAITLGEPSGEPVAEVPVDLVERATHYDRLAADVYATLPAGSSAGGEQAKFLTALSSGERVLVKFTPPRGTPFGERWHDLLHAEALALQLLAEQGFAVARCSVIESPRRTYLESIRFDRPVLGSVAGRRHMVALDAVHAAFVPGPPQHWAASCEALARQRRLSTDNAASARHWLHFGRLIGNTDMHFGNLSLWVDDAKALAKGRFALTPLYDMLPMRWRPDPHSGELGFTPFQPAPHDLASPARADALRYWQRLADHTSVSAALRNLAAQMHDRVAGHSR